MSSVFDRDVRVDAKHGIPIASVGKWLLGLFAIALIIRLTYLASKPAWMDEVSTILFSLGNYSRLIPTDQVITLEQMIRPLKLTPGATATDAVTNLLAENNHPPLYFALAHWWMMLFHRVIGTSDGYASLWASRALPAFFGALAVPATYWLGWLSFRDRLIALLCAAIMAISPFSVFLSQEARHYSLAILTVIGSLCCFVVAVQKLQQRQTISWLTVLSWIVVNALGIAVHYFCGITYFVEGLVLLVLLVRQCVSDGSAWRRAYWVRIYIAGLGTAVGAAIWLPILLNFYGSPQTTYITSGSKGFKFWLGPIAQSVVGWLYAVLSPVTSGYGPWAVALIVVSCVLVVFGVVPWLVVNGVRSLKYEWTQPDLREGLFPIGSFFVMGNLVFLAICYGAGFDITRGHRYSFVFYPSIVILAGAALAPFWDGWVNKSADAQQFSQVKLPYLNRYISGRTFVLTVLFIGFLGAQTIVLDRSHLKFYKADRFVDFMQAESVHPVIVGAQTVVGDQPSVLGIELISAAWEVQRQLSMKKDGETSPWVSQPRFILAELNLITGSDPIDTIESLVLETPRPFDLWTLGIVPILKKEGCSDPMRGNKGSFAYSHYICD